jgi:signal transduction histidine kinase
VLDRLPVRWRLAVTSSALTFVILCGFAIVVGQLTASRIRSDFNNELAAAVDELRDRLRLTVDASTRQIVNVYPRLDLFAAPNNATIRVLNKDGTVLAESDADAPNLGFPLPARGAEVQGYRVETRQTTLRPTKSPSLGFTVSIQYARQVSDLEHTVDRVRVFLAGGVLTGTLLALVAGLVLARRAMAPIAGLTATARRISRTRDPNERVPVPAGDDEIAELAATLDDMLASLGAAREETEATLERQRRFVADASHELRTPLTSVLANLELLADVLDGERGEAARSALRSSRRMRRLVADLLLLARADAKRALPRRPTDLGRVLVSAAAELGPLSEGHDVHVDAHEAVVDGAGDELHRLALNLLENAVRHTPPGTRVRAHTGVADGEAVLVVEDDGPGVPAELRDQVFERFVRGSGDHGGSAGLGLSIVRAVAESHGGTVTLADRRPGARFVVRLPLSAVPAPAPA